MSLREREGEPGAERARAGPGKTRARTEVKGEVCRREPLGMIKRYVFKYSYKTLFRGGLHSTTHGHTRALTHAHAHAHMLTYTQTHMLTHAHAHTHAHTHTHGHTWTHAHTHSHTLMHTHTLTQLTFALANRLPCIMTEKMRSHSHALGDCLRVCL